MWLYNNTKIKTLEDFPPNTIGFVYKVTNLNNNQFYIGKKILKNTKNVKLGKKEKAILVGVGRKPSKKSVITESNWVSYYGSSKLLLSDIKKFGKGTFKREILKFCYSKKEMSYFELKYQFIYEVLEHPEISYNENISGKWFRKDLLAS